MLLLTQTNDKVVRQIYYTRSTLPDFKARADT